jgi:hypothetical protein
MNANENGNAGVVDYNDPKFYGAADDDPFESPRHAAEAVRKQPPFLSVEQTPSGTVILIFPEGVEAKVGMIDRDAQYATVRFGKLMFGAPIGALKELAAVLTAVLA